MKTSVVNHFRKWMIESRGGGIDSDAPGGSLERMLIDFQGAIFDSSVDADIPSFIV